MAVFDMFHSMVTKKVENDDSPEKRGCSVFRRPNHPEPWCHFSGPVPLGIGDFQRLRSISSEEPLDFGRKTHETDPKGTQKPLVVNQDLIWLVVRNMAFMTFHMGKIIHILGMS
jgi:hypothetical protein